MGRRALIQPELVRVAYMAGGGASASQIAAAFGPDVSVERIYAICHRHNIALLPKIGNERIFPIKVRRKTLAAIAAHAAERGACPQALAGAVLDEVVDEPELLRSLVVDACAEEA